MPNIDHIVLLLIY